MQISPALAGYSLGQADLLRRAMGKKKTEVDGEGEAPSFLEGAEKNGVDLKVADEIFDLMEKFAEYGFNKSHSAAYGLVTYQTAYLKRTTRSSSWPALLTCDKDNTDKVVKHIAEARAHGHRGAAARREPVAADFSVVKETVEASRSRSKKKFIRFGLSAVKGVGEGAVESIIAAREKDGRVQGPVRLLPAHRSQAREQEGARGADQVGRVRRPASAGEPRGDVGGARPRGRRGAEGGARARERADQPVRAHCAADAAPARRGDAQVEYPDVDEWTPKQQAGLRERVARLLHHAAIRSIAIAADLKRFRRRPHRRRAGDAKTGKRCRWPASSPVQGVAAQERRRAHGGLPARGHATAR